MREPTDGCRQTSPTRRADRRTPKTRRTAETARTTPIADSRRTDRDHTSEKAEAPDKRSYRAPFVMRIFLVCLVACGTSKDAPAPAASAPGSSAPKPAPPDARV